jgi:hypothetical protein
MKRLKLSQCKSKGWRGLYTAALFETNRSMIPDRIAEAQDAIVTRARELFSECNDTIEEEQALDDAMYALRALQSGIDSGSVAA